jgi:uncharacterized protein (TIGR02246 family)
MTRRIIPGLVALALTLPCAASAQAGGDLKAQINKTDQAWEKAYNAGDAAGVTALYAKDGALMPPGSESVTGTSAIHAYWAEDIKGGAKMALTTGDVLGGGDHAVATGKWVATSADGKHLDHGTYMEVLKKESGTWKLYRDTWNSSMAKK